MYSRTGYDVGQFNKIRDIAKLDDGRCVIVDHRNHRVQVMNADLTCTTPPIEVCGIGSRLILPGNVCVLNADTIAVDTVKYDQKVCLFKLSAPGEACDTFHFGSEDIGPGGLVALRRDLYLTSYVQGTLYKLAVDMATVTFTKSAQCMDLRSPGAIDVAEWHSGMLRVVCCGGLGGKYPSRVLDVNFGTGMVYERLTSAAGIKLNFTHSAGSISTLHNHTCAIADTGNNRILVYNAKDLLVGVIKNIKSPVSVCIYSVDLMLISQFTHKSKRHRPDSDYLCALNWNTGNPTDECIPPAGPGFSSQWSQKIFASAPPCDTIDLLRDTSTASEVGELMKVIWLDSPVHVVVRAVALSEALRVMVEAGKVVATKDLQDPSLCIYQYKQELQTRMDGWNVACLLARGLVMRNDTVIALPFPKFWNCSAGWGTESILNKDRAEISLEFLNNRLSKIGGAVTVEEKLDGCLGIAFYDSDGWRVTTKGNPNSDIGRKATEWLRGLCIDFPNVTDTYLFEIIDPDNPLVERYTSIALVLLGGYSIDGYEVPRCKLDALVRTGSLEDSVATPVAATMQSMTDQIEFLKTFDKGVLLRRPVIMDTAENIEMLMDQIRNWHGVGEGVVVTFCFNDRTTYKVKIKTNEFITTQRQQNCHFTPKFLLKVFQNPNRYKEALESMEEEDYDFIIQCIAAMNEQAFERNPDPKTEGLRMGDPSKFNELFVSLVRSTFTVSDAEFAIASATKKSLVTPSMDITSWLDKVWKNSLHDMSKVQMYAHNFGIDVVESHITGNEHVVCVNYDERCRQWTTWARQARGALVCLRVNEAPCLLRRLLDRGYQIPSQYSERHRDDVGVHKG
jgi:hypothetical protein